MAAASASPEWEENLRKLDELCTLRKVEMLKEACEMLTSHAQQLEKMAKDSHRSILNIFSIFAQSKRKMQLWEIGGINFLFAWAWHVEETEKETFLAQ